jgi:cation diffusion facilitator CzcD-associated flavoprotein CzcO
METTPGWAKQAMGSSALKRQLRVVTIGAGISGINMAYQIKRFLAEVEHVVYEKNRSVGGTWYENRYPGCGKLSARCS